MLCFLQQWHYNPLRNTYILWLEAHNSFVQVRSFHYSFSLGHVFINCSSLKYLLCFYPYNFFPQSLILVVKITTLFLLTWAFSAYIIEIAFEQNSCPKAKNKNRFQNNSTLHMKGSVLLAVTDPFTFSDQSEHFFSQKNRPSGLF